MVKTYSDPIIEELIRRDISDPNYKNPPHPRYTYRDGGPGGRSGVAVFRPRPKKTEKRLAGRKQVRLPNGDIEYICEQEQEIELN